VGPLYLPSLLVGLVTLAIAGLVATRIGWMPALGAAFAAILLIGAATFGSASVSFRLTHPGLAIGFIRRQSPVDRRGDRHRGRYRGDGAIRSQQGVGHRLTG